MQIHSNVHEKLKILLYTSTWVKMRCIRDENIKIYAMILNWKRRELLGIKKMSKNLCVCMLMQIAWLQVNILWEWNAFPNVHFNSSCSTCISI